MICGNGVAGVMSSTPAAGMLNTMSSTPAAEPAMHSPASTPDAMLVLAAVIASRRVQTPSLAAVSAVELTVIVAAHNAGETAMLASRGRQMRRTMERS